VEKAPDADILRKMIDFAAKRPMELEIGAKTGAAFGERSEDRLVQRNGYRDRDCETRAGTFALCIPKLAGARTFRSFSSSVADGREGLPTPCATLAGASESTDAPTRIK
jgi:hypothetical protein